MASDKIITEPRECRSCHAAIYWVTWEVSGKSMPVDAQPSPDGTVVVAHRPSTNQLIAEKYYAPKHQGRKRYTSHFATCPNSKSHRREP